MIDSATDTTIDCRPWDEYFAELCADEERCNELQMAVDRLREIRRSGHSIAVELIEVTHD